MGLPVQVSERIVLAQKAYILFYMRSAPHPASALSLHSRPLSSPRASASLPRAGLQQGLGDKAPAATPAEQPAREAKRAAEALAPAPANDKASAAQQGLGTTGAQPSQRPRTAPASPCAAGHRMGAGAAPAAQSAAPGMGAAPGVGAAGSAGAGPAGKRGAPAAEPGASRPKKRARVLASMLALPTGLAAAQVSMLQPRCITCALYVVCRTQLTHEQHGLCICFLLQKGGLLR